MITIGKIFTFETHHVLPFHNGKCRNPHGHSYKLEVALTGPVRRVDEFDSESGMVMDFSQLSAIWKEHLEPYLDHPEQGKYLPEMFADDNDTGVVYPTAENLVYLIAHVFENYLPKGVSITFCKLWETETSYAIYS